METVAALIFIALLIAGFVCAIFLLAVQPIWGIVDVAVSKEHSGGTKAVVIILTLLVLGPIMTFFYACFGTRSNALRRATLGSFIALVLVGVSAIGLSIAVPAAKKRWSPGTETAAIADQSVQVAARANRLSADQVASFTALHLVPKDASEWSVSIAEFTGYGPKSDSTIPLVLPSIYPICHLAIDTNGPVYYAITTHQVGRINPGTGQFAEIESDPAIGKPSWPSGIAYDSSQGLLFVTARSQGYSYNPSAGVWNILPGLKDDDLVGLTYASQEKVLYSLRTRPGGGQAIKLAKFSRNGTLLGEVDLSQPIPFGQYPFPMAQLCESGDQLIVLVSATKDRTSPLRSAMYSVNPASGLCRLIETEAAEAEHHPNQR